MPITLITFGAKEATQKRLEKKNIAAIVLEPFTNAAALRSQYTKVVVIDTEENREKVLQWLMEDSGEVDSTLEEGTLLHFSYGGAEPSVTRGLYSDGGVR